MRRVGGLLVLVALFGVAAGKGKKPKTPPKVEGWHKEATWTGSCYYPINFGELGVGDRKIARQTVLQEMMAQWTGQKGDGVNFDALAVENMETALLGKPEWIESVSRDNLEQCKKAMSGGGPDGWGSWISAETSRITEGDCESPPLDYTLFDYLNIGAGWQVLAGVCKGDVVRVTGSTIDYYVVREGGPWINVVGDTSKNAVGEYPCTIEGCVEGMLIMKYVDYNGIETILPVGQERVFEVPNHGEISVRINDNTFYDNRYKQEGSLIHHTGITYAPADWKP